MLEIKKARGQPHFIGKHDFDILPRKGIRVFPSLHARSQGIPRPERTDGGRLSPGRKKKTVAFGCKVIDEAIKPGLTEGSTTLLWGPPGAYKTNLAANFLMHREPGTCPAPRALFVTFKIEPAAFLELLRKEARQTSESLDDCVRRMEIVQARDPFELPTSVFTRIMEKIDQPSNGSQEIQRAVIFGLRRLSQLPAYKGSEWQFLEVLVSFLHSKNILTLLVDWPETPTQEGPPIAIDLCANELRTRRTESEVKVQIQRRNYELVGVAVSYSGASGPEDPTNR